MNSYRPIRAERPGFQLDGPTEEGYGIGLMNDAAARISEMASISAIMNYTIGAVSTICNCDCCAIYLLQGEELVLQASSRPGAELGKMYKQVRVGTERTEGDWKPVVLSDLAYNDSQFLYFHRPSKELPESFLSIPMIIAGRLVGVINAQSCLRSHFTDRAVQLVSVISHLAGTRIEIVRLNKDHVRLAQSVEAADDINQATKILQNELGLAQPEAYLLLQRESRRRRKSMMEVAEAIIVKDDLKSGTTPASDALKIIARNRQLLS